MWARCQIRLGNYWQRLNTHRVAISRTEQGDLLIHSLPVDRGAELMNALLAFDEEFAAVLEEDRALQPIDQQIP
jgi:antitoxin VapB